MRYPSFALAALLSLAALPALAAPPAPPAPASRPSGPAPATAATPAATAAPTAAAPAAAPVEEPPTDDMEAVGPWVYMVARVKLTGTDFTQVVFFRHPAITTMEECETERAAGLTSGWVHFNRQYFRTLKGIAYKVDYRCVEGEQYLAIWKPSNQLDRFYLVRTTDGKLRTRLKSGFFACRDALRKITREEGIDAFCAKASQAILKAPVADPESDEEAATDAPPPAAETTVLPEPAPAKPAALPWQ